MGERVMNTVAIKSNSSIAVLLGCVRVHFLVRRATEEQIIKIVVKIAKKTQGALY